MPIYTEWHNTDKTILLTTYRDAWTWHEYEAHETAIVMPMLKRVNTPICRILDLRRSHWLQPMQFKQQIKRSATILNEFDIQAVCFLVGDPSTGVLLEATFKAFGQTNCQYKAVSTLDKAHQHLQGCFQHTDRVMVSA